jgi:hypothetical protein
MRLTYNKIKETVPTCLLTTATLSTVVSFESILPMLPRRTKDQAAGKPVPRWGGQEEEEVLQVTKVP